MIYSKFHLSQWRDFDTCALQQCVRLTHLDSLLRISDVFVTQILEWNKARHSIV